MATAVPKLLVVGGNGFLGSAICKSAVIAGWDVSSMSSSGKPYTTPAGHTPPWVHHVTWHCASAFEPEQYRDLLSDRTAVVHSLGILLEDAGYKKAIKDGNVFGVARAVGASLFGGPAPLRGKEEMRRGYEGMNRDSALTVLDTYLDQLSSSSPPPSSTSASAGSTPSATDPSPAFVYISAADAFRPLIPARYLETKREAEAGIAVRCAEHADKGVRGIYMRPGLMYHPHTRPLSTLPSFLLSCTASLHDTLGANQLPLSPSNPIAQAARALQTHPLHVDHVASAVLKSIVEGRQGVVDVPTMRAWAGFNVKGKEVRVDESVRI